MMPRETTAALVDQPELFDEPLDMTVRCVGCGNQWQFDLMATKCPGCGLIVDDVGECDVAGLTPKQSRAGMLVCNGCHGIYEMQDVRLYRIDHNTQERG